jgi:hypothetical protein
MYQKGNQYVLAVYDYDGNTISTEATKIRNEKETILSYAKVHHQLVKAGLKPQLQIMDNECSIALKQYL